VIRVKTISKSTWVGLFRYLFLLEWGIRIVIITLPYKVKLVNPHSVPALVIATAIKFIHKCKLAYDTHEIETEQYLTNSKTKIMSKILEKTFIRHSDIVFTTTDGYSNWYIKTYELKNVYTVKNYSKKKDIGYVANNYMRNYCNLDKNETLFLYLGIINPNRGIEILIDVFEKLQNNKHIVFMGYGTLVDKVKEASNSNENIHFHNPVPSFDVHKLIGGSDVGLCLIPNTHLSYFHTLPNKMLECLNVGIPVIVSNHPDMSASVNEFNAGWPIEMNTDSIYKFLHDLKPQEIRLKKKNTKLWAHANTWDSQEKIIIDCYKKILT
jgi:glycosyltransferase involved in cell wall biosynthesis